MTDLVHGRGDQRDFVLGMQLEGWQATEVVRWRATEALGKPFALEITTVRKRKEGAIDVASLLDSPVTFRIATELRWRPVHGLIVGAEEIERTAELYLYRFTVAPPSYRMTQRVRYRTFVDQSLREILVALLENRSTEHPNGHGGLSEARQGAKPASTSPLFEEFEPAVAQYRFAVADSFRLDDPALRGYVVQYGESDSDLFHRLIEEEGLSYSFEHTDDAIVLVITDRPGQESAFDAEQRRLVRSDARGTNVSRRETVRSFRSGERLTWGGTTAREWDPARSQQPLQAFALDDAVGSGGTRGPDPALFKHDEFPSRDPEVGTPCVVPATLAVERRAAERSRRTGRGSVRSFEPGLKLTLGDDGALYDDQVIVITAVTTYATQLLPESTILDDEPWGLNGRGHDGVSYENEFHALPEGIVFRPERSTRRPRIHGIQTAVVSAEEVIGTPPEIHINELSQVRLRFPWDERVEPGRPSSCWTRVSQPWAGAGYGDLFVPRVGQEVLVAYIGGDPERPMVVGRVYNATNPLPYTKPTISTLKSKSSPSSEGYNELRFDDEAGNEEVYLQAEKNLNELVKASHSTSVGGDQSNTVGGDQLNTVKGDRFHTVEGHETNKIGAGRETTVVTDEQLTVTGALGTLVKGREVRQVLSTRTSVVAGFDKLTVEGFRETKVTGLDELVVGGKRRVDVKGIHAMTSSDSNNLSAPIFFAQGGTGSLMAKDFVHISDGSGASISLVGGDVVITGNRILLTTTGTLDLVAGPTINASAGVIKLNE